VVARGAGILGVGANGTLGVYRWRLTPSAAFMRRAISTSPGPSAPATSPGGTAPTGSPWRDNQQRVTHFSGTVNCFASDGTNLHVGGVFTEAGSTLVNEVARWNGTNWAALGGGVVGSGGVFALVQTGAVVYAGGSFTNIGGVPVNRVARWDGSSWSALGNGFNGSVKSLAFFRGVLFAGGSFTQRGDAGDDFHGIAQFDGSDWTHVPTISSWQQQLLQCARQ